MERILITGSAGFIGSALMNELKGKYDTIGVDKKNADYENLLNINNHFFQEEVKNVDMIIHLAANAMVRHAVDNPDLALENMQSTFNVLEYARKKGIKQIIFSSSREVYGNQDLKCCSELDARAWFIESPYASSKLFGESLLSAYRVCYGIDYTTLRFSNVFGNGDANDRLVPRLFKQLPTDKPIEIYGEDKVLDFTYIDDVVSGIVTAIENFNKLAKYNVPIYNVSSGQSKKLIDVAKYVKRMMKSRSEIVITNDHIGEVVHYNADVKKFRTLTKWRPKFTVYQGLRKMYEKI